MVFDGHGGSLKAKWTFRECAVISFGIDLDDSAYPWMVQMWAVFTAVDALGSLDRAGRCESYHSSVTPFCVVFA